MELQNVITVNIRESHIEVLVNKALTKYSCELIPTGKVTPVYELALVQGTYGRVLVENRSKFLYNTVEFQIVPQQGASDTKLVAYADREFIHNISGNYFNEENKDVDFCRCDRCGKNLTRNKVFVVEVAGGEHDGQILQVGGSCADELDCVKSVSKFQDHVRILKDMIEGFDDGEYSFDAHKSFGGANLQRIANEVKAVVTLCKSGGYVSKKASEISDKQSTAEYINSLNNEKIEEYFGAEDVAVEEYIQKAIAWLEAQQAERFETFHENALRVLKFRSAWQISKVGYAFKAVVAPKSNVKVDGNNNDLVVGDKYIFDKVEVINIVQRDSQYGTVTSAIALSDYGKIWFNLTTKVDVRIGDVVNVFGTVSNKKVDITFLNRPKLV